MPARELLIPPRRFRPEAGRFRWPARPILATCRTTDDLPLQQLRRELRSAGVGGARIAHNAFGPAALRVQRRAHEHGREAYRLRVAADGVTIWAQGDAGAYYALQTLRELVRVHGRSLPACRIDDWPDFPRRAVYHDCSRGKVPKIETLKALVERLAAWKINELQLYVEDVFRFRRHPKIGRGTSPFRADELLDLQAHCRRHHVRLVGSLASFGHMEKILVLPEYRHLAERPEALAGQYHGDLCPTDPGSIRLIGELYEEFLPLLKATDFNACCDETSRIGTGRSRRRANKIGLGRLYLEFVLKVHKLALKHGKRLNIWGDIVLAHPELIPDIPKDIVMLNWDYNPNGHRIDRSDEFTAAGLPLVCCPGTNSWQNHGTCLAQANGNIIKFARIARQLGAEGLLNTDWGDFGHRNPLGVSLHGFALGAASAWGGAQVKLSRFAEAFTFHTFGDRTGRLAQALKTLGGWWGGQLYHSLLEPLDPSPKWGSWMLGLRRIHYPNTKTTAVRRRLEATKALRFPRLTPQHKFEALAMEEFELARRMDVLACQRIIVGRDLRASKAVPARMLRRLADDTITLADDFARLWRARNRPSRLRDNLAGFRYAAAEARKLARS